MFIAATVLACPSLARAAGDELLGAASDHHLWLILDPTRETTAYDLIHHAWDEPGWHYRVQHSMSQPPVAMAAWDDRLWLVQPPRSVAGRWQREVFTAQVTLNAATGLYYTTPAGRLEMAAALPGSGPLAGCVAIKSGPVVLLLTAQRSGATILAGDTTTASQPFPEHPTLLRLEPGAAEWTELALPKGFEGVRTTMLGAAGDDGLVILEAAPDNPNRTLAYFQRSGGDWFSASLVLDLRKVRSLTSVAGQALAIMTDRDNDINLAYVRPVGVLPLGRFPRPAGKWTACGFDGRLVIIERDRGGSEVQLHVRTVEPLIGTVSQPMAFERQPITAGRLWQVTLLLGLSLSAVLALVLLRPTPMDAIAVDPARALPLGRRLIAATVDLAVGGLLAMLLLGCSAIDLLTLPMVTMDFSRSGPYVFMVALSNAIATLLETLIGRSIGKMLVGGYVAGLDGHRAARWRVMLRGAIRFIMWLIPPLAVFVITNNHLQGLPDMAAKTVVLGTQEPQEQTSDEQE